jgi:beta-aspartyl-peptidase (threonine type)
MAASYGLEMEDHWYFLIEERYQQLLRNREQGIVTLDHGGALSDTAKSSSPGMKKNPGEKRLAPISPASGVTRRAVGVQKTAEQKTGEAGAAGAAGKTGEAGAAATAATAAARVAPLLPAAQPGDWTDEDKFGTVGCVVKDRFGNLSSAGSTGGLCNKQVGRVGDTAIIGAGVYADNATAAVACTGKGEVFIQNSVGKLVVTRMELLGESVDEALRAVIVDVLPAGTGGAITVDRYGTLSASYNTTGMFTGMANSSGLFEAWDRYRE